MHAKDFRCNKCGDCFASQQVLDFHNKGDGCELGRCGRCGLLLRSNTEKNHRCDPKYSCTRTLEFGQMLNDATQPLKQCELDGVCFFDTNTNYHVNKSKIHQNALKSKKIMDENRLAQLVKAKKKQLTDNKVIITRFTVLKKYPIKTTSKGKKRHRTNESDKNIIKSQNSSRNNYNTNGYKIKNTKNDYDSDDDNIEDNSMSHCDTPQKKRRKLSKCKGQTKTKSTKRNGTKSTRSGRQQSLKSSTVKNDHFNENKQKKIDKKDTSQSQSDEKSDIVTSGCDSDNSNRGCNYGDGNNDKNINTRKKHLKGETLSNEIKNENMNEIEETNNKDVKSDEKHDDYDEDIDIDPLLLRSNCSINSCKQTERKCDSHRDSIIDMNLNSKQKEILNEMNGDLTVLNLNKYVKIKFDKNNNNKNGNGLEFNVILCNDSVDYVYYDFKCYYDGFFCILNKNEKFWKLFFNSCKLENRNSNTNDLDCKCAQHLWNDLVLYLEKNRDVFRLHEKNDTFRDMFANSWIKLIKYLCLINNCNNPNNNNNDMFSKSRFVFDIALLCFIADRLLRLDYDRAKHTSNTSFFVKTKNKDKNKDSHISWIVTGLTSRDMVKFIWHSRCVGLVLNNNQVKFSLGFTLHNI